MENNDSDSAISNHQEPEKSSKVTFAPDITSLHAERPCMPRLVERSGTCNVVSRTIRGRRKKFFNDIFTTLLDTPWRLLLPVLTTGILSSWLLFAASYYITAKIHGDFEDVKEHSDWVVCVANAPDFMSMLLFSFETQTTIGYGYRYVSDECEFAAILVVFQSILGALMTALMTGMIIAKVQKPKKRANTIMFSRNACMYEDKTSRYLSIRVGDLQKTDMIDANARAVCVKDRISQDGEFISHFRYDLDLWSDKNSDRINLRWPCILRHRITPCSPFWNMDQEECLDSNFELIIFLEGIIETTGMTVCSRTSYLPRDIRWESKFKPMSAKMTLSGNNFDFDFSDFDEIVPSMYVADDSCVRRKTYFVRKASPTDSSYGTSCSNGDDTFDSDDDGSPTDESDETSFSNCSEENHGNFILVTPAGRNRKISTDSMFSLCSDGNKRVGVNGRKSSPTTSRISTLTFDNLNYYSE